MRVLYVKCFSLILFLLSFPTLAAVFDVVPVDKRDIATGDFVKARIVPVSPEAEVPALKGKRLGGILYVMSQKDDVVEAVVAPPNSVQEATPQRDGHRFTLQGFEYDHKRTAPLQDFLTENPEYDLSKKNYAIWILAAILVLVLLPALVKNARRAKRKRELKRARENELREILRKVEEASTREEIESLYPLRRELAENFEYDKAKFESFFSELFKLQYKPTWSESEKRLIEEEHRKFKKQLSLKRGI